MAPQAHFPKVEVKQAKIPIKVRKRSLLNDYYPKFFIWGFMKEEKVKENRFIKERYQNVEFFNDSEKERCFSGGGGRFNFTSISS